MRNSNHNHYFSVTVRGGHMKGGAKNYLPVELGIIAVSPALAAEKARNRPRIKHHAPIDNVREITYAEFCSLRKEEAENPYFRCTSIQMQRRLCNFEGLVRPMENVIEDYQDVFEFRKNLRRRYQNRYCDPYSFADVQEAICEAC